MIQCIYVHHTSEFLTLVWKFQFSKNTIPPSEKSKIYKEFLSKELKNITQNIDCNLFYNDDHKPLIDDITYKSISISHTQNYLAIQLHKQTYAGIDIETPRSVLLKVQDKFLSEREKIKANNDINILCKMWSTKEALFKIHGIASILLKQNIRIIQINNETIFSEIKINSNIQEKYQLFSQTINLKHSSPLYITYVVSKN